MKTSTSYHKSNLPGGEAPYNPPISQHKRLAMGMSGVDGTSNPNGAATASTENMIANNQGKTY